MNFSVFVVFFLPVCLCFVSVPRVSICHVHMGSTEPDALASQFLLNSTAPPLTEAPFFVCKNFNNLGAADSVDLAKQLVKVSKDFPPLF